MLTRAGEDTNQSGFTLIEVMAAMVVFTGGVLMVMNLAETLGTQLQRSGVISELSSVVREQVDSLAALGYDGLAARADAGSWSDDLDLRPDRTWTLSREVTNYSPLVREITVSAVPSGFTGPSRSYSTWVADAWE